jgi:hypothetical protein
MNINNLSQYSTFTISTRPYYEEGLQQYKNILVTNIEPLGPLRRFVRRININNRQQSLYNNSLYYDDNNRSCCIFAIVSLFNQNGYNNGYNNCCNGFGLMTPDEVPNLISFLQANGYQIETQLTNMLHQTPNIQNSNGSKIAFTVTYFGDKQPPIVYIK